MRGLPLFLALAVLLLATGWSTCSSAQANTVVKNGSVIYPRLDVNIDDNGKLARLHLAFEVECLDERAAEVVAAPQTREAIILFLREKTVTELSTPKGKRKLKDDLLTVINKAVGGPRAVRIFLMELVVL
jgi:flagellar FliL protein